MGHLIEPASSGRAKCRACKLPIEKGRLRFGEAVPNPFGEGDALQWFHIECAAWRRPGEFLEALKTSETDIPGRDRLAAEAEHATHHRRLPRLTRLEAAPSGRARCRQCRQLIAKGTPRISLEIVEDGMANAAGFVHVGCVHAYAGSVRGLWDRLHHHTEGLEESELNWVRTELERQAALPEAEEPELNRGRVDSAPDD